MAIIRALETKFGIKATYHRITAVNINYMHKTIVLCVSTYISKDTRQHTNQPIEEIDIDIPQADYKNFLNVNPIEQGYHWLKENVIGFEDATDDFDVLEPPVDIIEEEQDISE